MDKDIFVQNVKRICAQRGIKPTIACKESGAGKDLINQIETRGSIPSVEKVQMLAAYLEVTVSDLLGETPPSGGPAPDILVKFSALTPDNQEEVMAIVEMKLAKQERRTL